MRTHLLFKRRNSKRKHRRRGLVCLLISCMGLSLVVRMFIEVVVAVVVVAVAVAVVG